MHSHVHTLHIVSGSSSKASWAPHNRAKDPATQPASGLSILVLPHVGDTAGGLLTEEG